MNKRERLERTLAGEKADRIPIMLWRHFPGDDQRATDFAQAVIAFQQDWDFDCVKVTPANTYNLVDYGIQDEWVGRLDGTRDIIRRVIKRSLDWTELRRLEPGRGSLDQQLESLHLLGEVFGEEVPFIQTVYSPLTQACMLAGQETLIRNLRTHPDRLKTGLNIITDNTLRHVESLAKTGIAGIYYEMDMASYAMMSKQEYELFGCLYDQKILGLMPSNWWFNVAHLSGNAPMIEVMSHYPVQVISWEDRESHLSLSEGKVLFDGAVCGGLRRQTMNTGMPGEIREQALDAIEQAYGLRLILSTSAPLMVSNPRANLRTARQIVEDVARRL
jgi:uroporphyrinogen decarboxylase